MSLSGLWGSYLSRIDGKAMKTPFRRGVFSKIALRVGVPVVAEEAGPAHLRAIVAGLRGECM